MKNAVVAAGVVAFCWMWAEALEDILVWVGVQNWVVQAALVILITAVLARLLGGPSGKPPFWQRWLWRRALRSARVQR